MKEHFLDDVVVLFVVVDVVVVEVVRVSFGIFGLFTSWLLYQQFDGIDLMLLPFFMREKIVKNNTLGGDDFVDFKQQFENSTKLFQILIKV